MLAALPRAQITGQTPTLLLGRSWTTSKSTFTAKMNYAAAAGAGHAASGSRPSRATGNPPHNMAPTSSDPASKPTGSRPRRSPSPSHVPRTTRDDGTPADETVYVLTLLTDAPHHARMTGFRKQYFPSHLNKLDAHLTLFHALPGSKLAASIVPVLEQVAQETVPFEIHATRPFRLKKGIAIAVPKTRGGAQAADVHARLLERWERERWLSEQDAQRGGGNVHYTLMNKADDEALVEKAFEEVKGFWKTDVGVAQGLGLWRYERGWWKWERGFDFHGEVRSAVDVDKQRIELRYTYKSIEPMRSYEASIEIWTCVGCKLLEGGLEVRLLAQSKYALGGSLKGQDMMDSARSSVRSAVMNVDDK
nr:hypothetical protein CFP56_00559 [Quercus suber]